MGDKKKPDTSDRNIKPTVGFTARTGKDRRNPAKDKVGVRSVAERRSSKWNSLNPDATPEDLGDRRRGYSDKRGISTSEIPGDVLPKIRAAIERRINPERRSGNIMNQVPYPDQRMEGFFGARRTDDFRKALKEEAAKIPEFKPPPDNNPGADIKYERGQKVINDFIKKYEMPRLIPGRNVIKNSGSIATKMSKRVGWLGLGAALGAAAIKAKEAYDKGNK